MTTTGRARRDGPNDPPNDTRGTPVHPIRRTPRLLPADRAGRPARPVLLGPLLVLALAVAGCGDDDSDDNDDAASVASSTAPTGNSTGDGTDSGEATEVIAVDYHFNGLPDRIDAGTRLTMRNDSTVEAHELVAMPIPPQETRSADELVALPEEELFAAVPGEPALVLLAPPGEEAVPMVGDGRLDAGRYLVFCAIPTGADPDEFMRRAQASPGPPDVPGGPPHVAAGMFAELTVD